MSKSLVDYKLTPETGTQKIVSTLESDLTTIKVYNTIPDLDSLKVRLQATDSINSQVDTLLYVKFPKKESTKEKFIANIESANLDDHKSILSAVISFTKPVVNFTSDSMYVQVDSLNRITFVKTDFKWNEQLTKLTISKKLEEKPKSTLTPSGAQKETQQTKKIQNLFTLAKGLAISIEKDSSTRMTKTLKAIKPEDHATVSTKVQTKENFILQLLDKNNKVIEETINTKTHIFESITPGTYCMRVMIDLNKNGKWDAGNYKNRTQPEPIIFYTNPKGGKDIFLKANWQVGDLLISY